MEILKNCKKALSVVMAPGSPYKDYIGTGNLPSGMAFEDYLMIVRKGMFKMLVEDLVVLVTSPTTTTTTSSTATNENAATMLAASYNTPPAVDNAPPATSDNEMTSDGSLLDDESIAHVDPTQASILGSWYFTGYYVFALLGPIVPSNMKPYCAELLMT
jgi:hypothetical protein